MIHSKPLAILYSRKVEMLYWEGVPTDQAIRWVRPEYYKALKSLKNNTKQGDLK